MNVHSQKQGTALISSRSRVVRILWLCLPLAVYLAAPPIPAAQEDSSGFSISKKVTLVVLPVSVRDKGGHFVAGLQASNFKVFDDGRPQEITVFRQEDVPVTVGVVVDHSGSMAARQLQMIEGAQAFVHASNPENREFVVNFGDTVSFGLPPNVAFTNNVDRLSSALSKPYASGTTALYDAIVDALAHAAQDDLPRKVLLLISDGGDNASQHSLAQALRAAQASNVVIYSIGLLDEHSADQNPDVLKKLAADTGGEAYFPNSLAEIVGVCEQIAADVRELYTVGYGLSDKEAGGYHQLRVAVTARGRGRLFVRTRAGYIAPSPESNHTASENDRGH